MGQAAGPAGGLRRAARDAAAGAAEHVVGGHPEAALAHDHPEGDPIGVGCVRGDRAEREALGLLTIAASPDPEFADDMENVLADAGPIPDDPWARS